MTHTHHQSRPHPAVTLAGVLCASALALAACGQSADSNDATTAPSSTETTASAEAQASTPSETTTAAAGDEGASTSEKPQRMASASSPFKVEDVRVTQTQPADLMLQDIRVGQHEGYDRVVFEYAGTGAPSYLAGYVDTPRQQASGNPMQVPGAAHLELIVQGTAGDMMRLDEPITQIGSKGVSTRSVQDVYLASIFEADSQFFLGLDRQRGFHVFTLENPTRIVVDIDAN